MSEVVLVGVVIEFRRVVNVSTVAGGCHSAPNDVSCMCISLHVSKFHA